MADPVAFLPPHVQMQVHQEMQANGFERDQWEEYSAACRSGEISDMDCTVFNRIQSQLEANNFLALEDMADDIEGLKQALSDGWNKLGDYFNSIGYDGWQPPSDEVLLENQGLITRQFFKEYSEGNVSPQTMEQMEQLKEMGADFVDVTQQVYDQVEQNPAHFGLGVETDPDVIQKGHELGNEGQIYKVPEI